MRVTELTPSVARTIAAWRPRWSSGAAIRALRAAVVMPGLFALADEVIGNLQVATFVAFGSFATLVLTTFGGGRRQKLAAHLTLALAGSALLTIGTAVSSSTALAATVTLPVVFAVSLAGVVGPNAAAGVNGALLAYVLPAGSVGTVSMIPDRLAGWWMASAAGTAAVMLVSPRAGAEPLRAAAASLARELAALLRAALAGVPTAGGLDAALQAKRQMRSRFIATPYRPTGLTASDEALADAVELLEWCTTLVIDAVHERDDLREARPGQRERVGEAAHELEETCRLLGGRAQEVTLTMDDLERATSEPSFVSPVESSTERRAAQLAFHVHIVALTARAVAADALVVAGRAGPDSRARVRERWLGAGSATRRARRRVAATAAIVSSNASVRSAWTISSLRSAVALSGAVLVADLTSVQHGFWVVLGALSVLRTNAAATGATALRALLGTVLGFVVGGAILVAIGADRPVLWALLPLAVFLAAYAPGTLPFAAGQAAFTITIAILFNLLAPVGWKIGVVRIEDVALGVGVSVVAGVLFWPRGLASVVGDDLADSFRSGSLFLRQSVAWAAGSRAESPDAGAPAASAATRLEEALRGFLAERGSKGVEPGDLWRLVGGSMRLRLTALSITTLPRDGPFPSAARSAVEHRAGTIAGWFEQLAELVGRPGGPVPAAFGAPVFAAADTVLASAGSEYAVWMCENLDHLADHLGDLVEPARSVARARRRPWWA